MFAGLDLDPADFLRRRKWLATIAVNLCQMAAVLASTMVNVAIPDIMGAFGVGQDTAHWLSTGFLSAMTVCMLLSAWLIARIGPRRTLLLAAGVFTIASFLGQTGTNIEMVILARVLQGASAGLLQPLALTVIYAVFPPEERGRAMGIFGMGVVLGPALGPTLGGLIVDDSSWRYVFTGAVPVMLIGAALSFSALPHRIPNVGRGRFNWLSFALIAVAVASFLTSLSNGQRLGWSSEEIVLGFLLAALAGLAFVVWEMLSANPLLQVRLFANSMFALSSIVGFIFGAGMFGSIYILPLFVRTVQEFTATKAGLLLMPAGLILMAVFPLAGRLAQHVPARGPVVAGLVLFGFSSLLLGDVDVNTAFWTLAGLTIVGRVGLGLIMPSLSLHGLRTLAPDLLPYGAGTMNFIRMLGAATGVNTVSVVLDRQTDSYREQLMHTQTADNPITRELLYRLNELLDQAGLSGLDRLATTMGYLRRLIEAQANALAHQDGFVLIGLIFLVGILPALLLGRGRITPAYVPMPTGRGGAVRDFSRA